MDKHKLKVKYIALSFQAVSNYKNQKILKTLQNNREKIGVLVDVHKSKIMRTPIKLGVRAYATYANC